ncbi:MAG: hypothetical protein ACRDYV_02525 [Acidimicrobiia bacterium]
MIRCGLLAALLVACQGKKGPEITDSDRVFPLPVETDLVVRLVPGAARPEVRRITVDLVLQDGVEATEAHYDSGEVRVVVSRDMSSENRSRLRSRLLESPEVTAVEVEPPED